MFQTPNHKLNAPIKLQSIQKGKWASIPSCLIAITPPELREAYTHFVIYIVDGKTTDS